ncbi:type IV secretory system conjugative DNA transfer family protein, partial [Devosia sp.]|jgi:hypothetical protein|uniref:type IV secretory system conjugative DNA transfer family protein n=1 Tax=Devosia sp. TaxID=1871048 RepID=UPI0037C0CDBA
MFENHNVGYTPRKHPGDSILFGALCGVASALAALTALLLLAPVYDDGGYMLGVLDPVRLYYYYYTQGVLSYAVELRLSFAAAIGTCAGLLASIRCWQMTPRTEPFQLRDEGDPKIFYDELAEIRLKQSLRAVKGADTSGSMLIAPYIGITRRIELRNTMIVGAPGSGKSNLLRPIAQQAIERGDVVILHCTKGDLAKSFRPHDIILVSPAHRDGWAWDIGKDIDGPAAAAEFAAAMIPASEQVFFSDTARIIAIDLIVALIQLHGQNWGPRQLLEAVLADRDEIVQMISQLDLSASPLLTSGSEDGNSRTIESVLATLISGAMTTLRPMAYAWSNLPAERRFSIKDVLSPSWTGPKVIVVQTHPSYKTLTQNVCGAVLKYVCQHVAAPARKGSKVARVTMVLDEFGSLGRIENFATRLSVAREKGLATTVALHSLDQLRSIYGNEAAIIAGLFQVKIYGMLEEGAEEISNSLGTRKISVTDVNRLPEATDKRRYVSKQEDYPVFTPAQFARELGNFDAGTPSEKISALLVFRREAYRIDWPPTQWKVQGSEFIQAAWTRVQPTARPPA